MTAFPWNGDATRQTLNRVGLTIGLFGVVMLSYWVPPTSDSVEWASLGLEDDNVLLNSLTVKQHNRRLPESRNTHVRHPRLAHGMIILVVM